MLRQKIFLSFLLKTGCLLLPGIFALPDADLDSFNWQNIRRNLPKVSEAGGLPGGDGGAAGVGGGAGSPPYLNFSTCRVFAYLNKFNGVSLFLDHSMTMTEVPPGALDKKVSFAFAENAWDFSAPSAAFLFSSGKIERPSAEAFPVDLQSEIVAQALSYLSREKVDLRNFNWAVIRSQVALPAIGQVNFFFEMGTVSESRYMRVFPYENTRGGVSLFLGGASDTEPSQGGENKLSFGFCEGKHIPSLFFDLDGAEMPLIDGNQVLLPAEAVTVLEQLQVPQQISSKAEKKESVKVSLSYFDWVSIWKNVTEYQGVVPVMSSSGAGGAAGAPSGHPHAPGQRDLWLDFGATRVFIYKDAHNGITCYLGTTSETAKAEGHLGKKVSFVFGKGGLPNNKKWVPASAYVLGAQREVNPDDPVLELPAEVVGVLEDMQRSFPSAFLSPLLKRTSTDLKSLGSAAQPENILQKTLDLAALRGGDEHAGSYTPMKMWFYGLITHALNQMLVGNAARQFFSRDGLSRLYYFVRHVSEQMRYFARTALNSPSGSFQHFTDAMRDELAGHLQSHGFLLVPNSTGCKGHSVGLFVVDVWNLPEGSVTGADYERRYTVVMVNFGFGQEYGGRISHAKQALTAQEALARVALLQKVGHTAPDMGPTYYALARGEEVLGKGEGKGKPSLSKSYIQMAIQPHLTKWDAMPVRFRSEAVGADQVVGNCGFYNSLMVMHALMRVQFRSTATLSALGLEVLGLELRNRVMGSAVGRGAPNSVGGMGEDPHNIAAPSLDRNDFTKREGPRHMQVWGNFTTLIMRLNVVQNDLFKEFGAEVFQKGYDASCEGSLALSQFAKAKQQGFLGNNPKAALERKFLKPIMDYVGELVTPSGGLSDFRTTYSNSQSVFDFLVADVLKPAGFANKMGCPSLDIGFALVKGLAKSGPESLSWHNRSLEKGPHEGPQSHEWHWVRRNALAREELEQLFAKLP